MNFIFHHHLATLDGEEPTAALGAMLPDLFRMVARTARTTPKALQHAAIEPGLLRGMHHHLQVDAWFHETASFHAGEEETRALLRDTGIARAGLFAHIVLEMALDGALIRRRDGALRASVAAAIIGREDDARAALHTLSSGRTTTIEEALLARVLTGVRSFALPEGYAEPAGLADRLQGIRRRFAFDAFTAAERRRLEHALKEILDGAGPLSEELERAWTSSRATSRTAGSCSPP